MAKDGSKEIRIKHKIPDAKKVIHERGRAMRNNMRELPKKVQSLQERLAASEAETGALRKLIEDVAARNKARDETFIEPADEKAIFLSPDQIRAAQEKVNQTEPPIDAEFTEVGSSTTPLTDTGLTIAASRGEVGAVRREVPEGPLPTINEILDPYTTALDSIATVFKGSEHVTFDYESIKEAVPYTGVVKGIRKVMRDRPSKIVERTVPKNATWNSTLREGNVRVSHKSRILFQKDGTCSTFTSHLRSNDEQVAISDTVVSFYSGSDKNMVKLVVDPQIDVPESIYRVLRGRQSPLVDVLQEVDALNQGVKHPGTKDIEVYTPKGIENPDLQLQRSSILIRAGYRTIEMTYVPEHESFIAHDFTSKEPVEDISPVKKAAFLGVLQGISQAIPTDDRDALVGLRIIQPGVVQDVNNLSQAPDAIFDLSEAGRQNRELFRFYNRPNQLAFMKLNSEFRSVLQGVQQTRENKFITAKPDENEIEAKIAVTKVKEGIAITTVLSHETSVRSLRPGYDSVYDYQQRGYDIARVALTANPEDHRIESGEFSWKYHPVAFSNKPIDKNYKRVFFPTTDIGISRVIVANQEYFDSNQERSIAFNIYDNDGRFRPTIILRGTATDSSKVFVRDLESGNFKNADKEHGQPPEISAEVGFQLIGGIIRQGFPPKKAA